MEKKSKVFLIFMLFAINVLAINFCVTSNKNTQTAPNQNKPIDSSVSIIQYNHYKYEFASVTPAYNITWSFSSSNDNVSITVMAMNSTNFHYFNTSQPYSYISLSPGNLTMDDGIFSPYSSDYWYIIYFNNDTDMQNTTLNYNTEFLSPNTSITITSPTSFSSWAIGSSYYIYWNSIGNITQVNITLYNNGIFYSTIASNVNNKGWYFWRLPLSITPNNSYEIVIKDAFTSTIYFNSDNFSIAPRNTLTITSPIYNDTWDGGSSYKISWTTSGSISDVNLYLLLDGNFYGVIATNITNTGKFTWDVQIRLSSTGPFEIEIVDSSNSNTYNISSNFNIISHKNPISNYQKSMTIGGSIVVVVIIFLFLFLIFISFSSKIFPKKTQYGVKDENFASYDNSMKLLDGKQISNPEQQSKNQNSNMEPNGPLLENVCPRCDALVKKGQKNCPVCGYKLIKDN